MYRIDLDKCSASELVSSFHRKIAVADITTSEYVEMHKVAGFFMSLIPQAAKFALKTIVPYAAISGAIAGATTEGDLKDKVLGGLTETAGQFVSPKKLISNFTFTGAQSGISGLMGKSNGIAKMVVGGAGGMYAGNQMDRLMGNTPIEGENDPFM